jgi:hypothetical protein
MSGDATNTVIPVVPQGQPRQVLNLADRFAEDVVIVSVQFLKGR